MIFCCGEAIIDMVPGTISGAAGNTAKDLGDGFLPCPGGSPYNTAIAIGRLRQPVQFLGRLSTDFFGDTLIDRLVQNQVGVDFITRSDQHSTLAFVKFAEGKEPQYIFYTEGTADRSFSDQDIPPRFPPEIRCILFGSISMTMEPIASAVESLIFRETARGAGPVISFDPNIRPFMIRDKAAYVRRMEKWMAASSIVKISAADLSFVYPNLELKQALQKILALGPRLLITTLGAEGATAILRRNDNSVIRAQAPIVDLPVVDTIGAGDTFHGAFLSWLEQNGKMSLSALASLSEQELYDALYFANKAASLVCSKQGAEPPFLDEVLSLG
jgi:fructokinase